MIDRATIESELQDAIRQRDEAHKRAGQLQQALAQAQQEVIGYSYAARQCEALLGKIEPPRNPQQPEEDTNDKKTNIRRISD